MREARALLKLPLHIPKERAGSNVHQDIRGWAERDQSWRRMLHGFIHVCGSQESHLPKILEGTELQAQETAGKHSRRV